MKRVMIFIFGVLFLMSFVVAQEINFKQIECQSVLGYKDQIIGQKIPDGVPFKTEIFNIYVAEESYGSLEVNVSVIEDFTCSENENATYDILIESEETLFDISESEDFASSILEKINNKEIEIKGKTFGNKIKSIFIKIGVKILSWFS